MKIAIGGDHASVALKAAVAQHLEAKGFAVLDVGTHSADSVDYPIYAKKVCEAVLHNEAELGVLICGTGIGVSIAANKLKGIRCALCGDTFSARMAREHNDANVIALGARVLGEGVALDIADAFVSGAFSFAENHARRLNLVKELENG